MAAGDITDGMVADVRTRVGAQSESGVLTPQILAYLNMGIQDMVQRLNDGALPTITATATGTVSAASAPCHATAVYFALPADFLRERIVKYVDSQCNRLDISRIDMIDHSGSHRAPSATNPWYYIWEDLVYIQSGSQSLVAYTFEYVSVPVTITTDVDPDIPVVYNDIAVDFAVALCRFQRKEFKEWQRIMDDYEERIRFINSRLEGPLSEREPGDIREG
jgi:hypothetical protein